MKKPEARTICLSKSVVGYIRVSTSGQAIDGVSLDAQKERIQAWAASQGVEIISIEEDAGLSGKAANNRPGLQRAIKTACKTS